jgi:hypothetical protein
VCSITGLSPTGNISFGMAFVNGSSREPRPAAGITALRIVVGIVSSFPSVRLLVPVEEVAPCGPHQLDWTVIVVVGEHSWISNQQRNGPVCLVTAK